MSEIFYSPFGKAGISSKVLVPSIDHATPGRYCDLLGLDEVQDLEAGQDFRRPEFRREVFLRFYEFHLKYRAHPGCVYFMMPYLYKKFNWTMDQRLWFAFLNGNTQHAVTSWLFFERFPDFKNLNRADLDKFYNTEFKRLEFDTDRRHQKSDFMESVDCYTKLTGGDQVGYFTELFASSIPYENFRLAWKEVREKFYSFGRLSSFSYLEYLRIMRCNLDCDNLLLEDMSGSKSHRNGLAKVLGRDDLDWHDSNPTGFNGKYSTDMMEWLNTEAHSLLSDADRRFQGRDFQHDVSYFTLESTFCTFKSWHRPGRRYPGCYLDMFYNRIKKAEERWPEEDLSMFWDARKQYLPAHLRLEDNPGDPGLKAVKQNHYRETGEVIMMDEEWPCFKNVFNEKTKVMNQIVSV